MWERSTSDSPDMSIDLKPTDTKMSLAIPTGGFLVCCVKYATGSFARVYCTRLPPDGGVLGRVFMLS